MAQGLIYTGIAIEEVEKILHKQHYNKKIDESGKLYQKGKINFYPMRNKEGTKIIFEDISHWKKKGHHEGMDDITKKGEEKLDNFLKEVPDSRVVDHIGKKYKKKKK